MPSVTTHPEPAFWRTHLGWPLVAWLAAFTLLYWSGLDVALVDAFYDPALGKFPAARGWWAHDLLHSGGKRFVYLIALGWLVVLVCGFLPATRRDWAPWRRAALFVLACLVVVPGIVGAMKQRSDTPCPAHSTRYGGEWPVAPLLEPSAYDLPGSGCFPGAHSSSAFALFGLYFVFRRSRPRVARQLLLAVGALGTTFAIGQSARGSHYLTHDLVSAGIAWLTCLALYALAWRSRLHPDDDRSAPR
jgi:membrane-associated PAP2 superfamily phosphatase